MALSQSHRADSPPAPGRGPGRPASGYNPSVYASVQIRVHPAPGPLHPLAALEGTCEFLSWLHYKLRRFFGNCDSGSGLPAATGVGHVSFLRGVTHGVKSAAHWTQRMEAKGQELLATAQAHKAELDVGRHGRGVQGGTGCCCGPWTRSRCSTTRKSESAIFAHRGTGQCPLRPALGSRRTHRCRAVREAGPTGLTGLSHLHATRWGAPAPTPRRPGRHWWGHEPEVELRHSRRTKHRGVACCRVRWSGPHGGEARVAADSEELVRCADSESVAELRQRRAPPQSRRRALQLAPSPSYTQPACARFGLRCTMGRAAAVGGLGQT
jgi:hypothetical protein